MFDRTELTTPRFFAKGPDPDAITFPLRDTRTSILKVKGRRLAYQHFWRAARRYDVVVVEHALNNLTYPLMHLHQVGGPKVAYWGTGRDMGSTDRALTKRAAEEAKLLLARRADGFFAYTDGVRDFLISRGLKPDRVWALGNTIDILAQRRMYEQHLPERDAIRRELGVPEDATVLLFVGRFTAGKKVDVLMDAFAELRRRDPRAHLLLVGDGGEKHAGAERVTYLGLLDDDELARIYVASDLFPYPGSVGLGPLQALCFDLPVVTIERDTHKSEFEYLDARNSLVMPAGTDAAGFAEGLAGLLGEPGRLAALRAGMWASIEHRTIERMADNFITGIDALLAR